MKSSNHLSINTYQNVIHTQFTHFYIPIITTHQLFLRVLFCVRLSTSIKTQSTHSQHASISSPLPLSSFSYVFCSVCDCQHLSKHNPHTVNMLLYPHHYHSPAFPTCPVLCVNVNIYQNTIHMLLYPHHYHSPAFPTCPVLCANVNIYQNTIHTQSTCFYILTITTLQLFLCVLFCVRLSTSIKTQSTHSQHASISSPLPLSSFSYVSCSVCECQHLSKHNPHTVNMLLYPHHYHSPAFPMCSVLCATVNIYQNTIHTQSTCFYILIITTLQVFLRLLFCV